MGTQPQSLNFVRNNGMKIILWALVAVYTFMLPDAIIVYRAIEAAYGKVTAGKIPLIIVVIVGIAYGAAILISHKSLKNLLFLVPCGVIAILIMKLVDNPNKHIHIPEYVLMAWLLYTVLSKDHKGKGIFILVFIYGTMLGVVDEMEQGINPARFYGLPDMMVNSASVLIGVFTLMGLKKVTASDLSWTAQLRDFQTLVGLDLFGFAGIVITCATLFQVQASGKFWGVYPIWLVGWNVLYVLLAAAAALYQGVFRKKGQASEGEKESAVPDNVRTARLWIIPLLVILFYMHSLAIYVAATGVKFD